MRRLTVFLATVLVALLTFAPSVGAAQPIIEDVNLTFREEFLSEFCGFEVTVTVTGMTITRIREGKTGEIIDATTGANFRVTLTGPTGKSVTFSVSGLQEITQTESTFTFQFSGRNTFLVIPGEGVVQLEAGRLTFTAVFDPLTGDIIEESFVFHGRQVFNLTDERLCQLLDP